MYNKILVPLDGSELSESIFEHVQEIATGRNVSEVILLRVVEQAETGTSYSWGGVISVEQLATLGEKVRTEATTYMSKVADRLKIEGTAIKTHIVQGSPADSILDYAQENQVDLIIMSTHGRSGISRWAFGSVAEKVIRNSPVPVLLASPNKSRAK